MLELAYVVAVPVVEWEWAVGVGDAVEEGGIRELLELERALALAVEGELTALRGMWR
jgi:hypothetical protein